ncbi:methylated-DNA--[protein]-cysteine S-methyltransferase [Gordonia sp. 'Campus']|uniref:methylated-DNA--[protein]-cysteine S-methyltransferase n=1 Tax=Gordonia sp. 'Campus' TaxID=2915824 RepID=UPI001EE3EE50|nr:methylated-DNA--[protein]-cysteine S-methyltransferase [Gordonia sp. 'Campus']
MTSSPSPVTASRALLATPVGVIAVDSDGLAVVGISWQDGSSPHTEAASDPVLTEAIRQLRAYFGGSLIEFDLPVCLDRLSGAARAVLTALQREVAHGQTITYGELAALSGTRMSARGVGTIMGCNPVPLVIPCHRVVAGDGLGGYSGGAHGQGLSTKRWLLEFEGALPPTLF